MSRLQRNAGRTRCGPQVDSWKLREIVVASSQSTEKKVKIVDSWGYLLMLETTPVRQKDVPPTTRFIRKSPVG